MSNRSKGSKLLCGCLVTILIILLIVAGIGAYALLYVPSDAKLAEKLDKKSNLTATCYTDASEWPDDVSAMVITLGLIINPDTEVTSIVAFKDSSDDEDGAYGIVLYTDSIKSAVKGTVDYVKFIMDSKAEDTEDLDLHVSCRGKAIFFGNAKGEVEFRKIII